MISRHFVLLFVIFVSTARKSFELECYVCKDQEHNREKCIRTVRTCEPEEDRCMSEVKWGSTLDWNLVLDSQYYMDKNCATQEFCEEAEKTNAKRCLYLPYEDWECITCCTGDRCNYYVTLTGQSLSPNLKNVAIIIITSITLKLKFMTEM